jgi:hypothetical protein
MSKQTDTNPQQDDDTNPLQDAIYLAGEALALAEAYSGGESETCDELTLQLTELEERASFINENLITILEAARVALEPYSGTFDRLAEDLDLSDEALLEILNGLRAYMGRD